MKRRVKRFLGLAAGSLAMFSALGADLQITTLQPDGQIVFSNTFSQGVVTVSRTTAVTGAFVPDQQTFSTGVVTQMRLAVSGPAAFLRGQALDLLDTWLFSFNDIADLASFSYRLGAQEPSDPVSLYVWNQLSNSTQLLIYGYLGGDDPVLQQALVDDLNAIIQSGPIYDAQVFGSVTLSPATQTLLGQGPQGTALVRLNRMLLEDAYPQELVKSQPTGFTNLVNSYGLLTTIAGAGGSTASPSNKWQTAFEGGPATNALLSHPHIAMADRAGNIFIADKEAHAIRKVTLDGTIHTVAGINSPGRGTTNPAPATTVALNNPNGLWVQGDGTFYILDRDNGLIRKVDTNGLCTLLVADDSPLQVIAGGRGLWVSPDESLVFYSAYDQLKRWDTTNGLQVLASGFLELGNLAVDPKGQLAVTDRKGNLVYWIGGDGTKTLMAGNGYGSGGGDDQLASATGLYQVRGIWFLPTGGCFLATDVGSQVWYLDAGGFIHLFLDGSPGAHGGDGFWFYDPATPKVSAVRQITMDWEGNLIITENDAGYIRRVRFLP